MSSSNANGLPPIASGSVGVSNAISASTTRGAGRGTRLGFHGGGEVVSRNGKSRSRAKSMVTPAEFTPEILETERKALLAEKQALLESINDQHDDMVRQLFHMQEFTLMLDYDPVEAKKKDRTKVFTDFQSQYDLLDQTASMAGPSRTTRRKVNERRQILAPTISAPPAASSSAKPKVKTKAANGAELPVDFSGLKTAKKLGKEKEPETILEAGPGYAAEDLNSQMDLDEPVESVSAPVIRETVVVRRRGGRKLSTAPHPLASDAVDEGHLVPAEAGYPEVRPEESISAAIPQKPARKRRREPSPVPLSASIPSSVEKAPDSIAIHANGDMKENMVYPETLPHDSSYVGLARRSGRLKEPPPTNTSPKASKIKVRLPGTDKAFNIAPSTPPMEPPTSHSSPSKQIKRIKLIVRRPPPQLTHPKQRAPVPKFKSNLSAFLSSYVSIGDDDKEVSILEKEALQEAKIREDVVRFRREGRFIPGTNVLFGTEPDETEYDPPRRESKDHWDAVLEEVIRRGKNRPRKSHGRQIAGQVASKVQAHFDALEFKKLKAKEAEEKRLRNLAKSTMKVVVAEWKKAVFHIRERQRLEEEAEERRLGHAHLDAILDQSGQLLETQQGDLIRGDTLRSRSRSGSVPDFDGDDEEDDETEAEESEGGDVEDDGDNEEEDEEGRPATQVDSDEELEDESSTMLLGGDFSTKPPTTRSATPATTSSGPPEEEEDGETATVQLLQGLVAAHDDVDMHSDDSSEPDLDHLMDPPIDATSPSRIFTPPRNVADFIQDGEGQPLPDELILEPTSKVAPDQPMPVHSLPRSPSLPPSTPYLSNSNSTSPSQALSEAVVEDVVPPAVTLANAKDAQIDGDITIDHADEPIREEHADRSQEHASMNRQEGKEAKEAGTPTKESLEEEEYGLVHEDHGLEVEQDEEDAEAEESHDGQEIQEEPEDVEIPEYLKPYAVTAVDWDPDSKVTPPLLLRGVLRPYQQAGLEWLASLHVNKLNGILADEMGLGKTIQTIALLAHLACDRGIWGPHLIVVPTSVLLNWEMEFKKFLPGFRILSYHGSTKRRKELRQGWNDKHHFNVCITSYALASRDAHIFKRKSWYYLILDEAHMIKNFKSQRWNILLMFRSYRRLLLTGTPLQNNLTELWALLQFLMSGANFANLKEFGEWFSNPLEKAIEMGNVLDDETMHRVSKLHTVLRPYLLRRLKRDVEKDLPSKFEHLTLCPLSKRQRFLYDEFMSRAQTQDALGSGVYQKIANILMQLRKVCNHPDLFEVRPIVTSFAMPRSAIADFEIKELLIRRRFVCQDEDTVDVDVVGLNFIDHQNVPLLTAVETRLLDATTRLPYFSESAGEPPPKDTRTIAGFRKYTAYVQRASVIARWAHMGYLNKLRCSRIPIYSEECLSVVNRMFTPIVPFSHLDTRLHYMDHVDRVSKAVKSYTARGDEMAGIVNAFAFVTPSAVAQDLPRIALSGFHDIVRQQPLVFDEVLHQACVKLQIAFPEPSLLQYDCGKMQRLASLLREKKAGGHRVLIFTQMTRILDILEIFLNFHGYLYLRLDGATKIEDRQYITERFNADPRVFCFISSSRSGGVGINLTGADTVIFYDSDFNPQMDRQCEDRAHRIGQIRDVHIYRFVSQHSVEEAMLRKANQKRSLDDLVIQKGEFDWRSLFNDESALTKALGEYEDVEDQVAAAVALREETTLVGADEDDFGGADVEGGGGGGVGSTTIGEDLEAGDLGGEDDDEDGGNVIDYMVTFVERDWEYFCDWRL